MEAVAAMLTRVGIRADVEAMPWSAYSSRQYTGGERGLSAFSVSLIGFGTANGETMSQHWMLLHARNTDRGGQDRCGQRNDAPSTPPALPRSPSGRRNGAGRSQASTWAVAS